MKFVLIDDDPVQQLIIKEYCEEIEDLQIVGSFDNPVEFLKKENNLEFDFIILDMEMPKMSGIDLLNTLDKPTSVLVISSKPEYAIEVINHNVLGYLLKPVKLVDFIKTIQKISTLLPNQNNANQALNTDEYLFVKSNGMLHQLKRKEITHIAAAVDYIEVFTTEKKYLVHSTMTKMEEKLQGNDFYRIHRSSIINIKHIKRIDRDFVEVGDQNLKISPSKKEGFLSYINSL